MDIDIDDDIRSSLNTLLDTRSDGNSLVADQCNSILERIAGVQSDDRSSDSLDLSSNRTVLHITEEYVHETLNNGKNVEENKEKQWEEGKRGGQESYKKGENRKSGHFEKCPTVEKQGSEGPRHAGEEFVDLNTLNVRQTSHISFFVNFRKRLAQNGSNRLDVQRAVLYRVSLALEFRIRFRFGTQFMLCQHLFIFVESTKKPFSCVSN